MNLVSEWKVGYYRIGYSWVGSKMLLLPFCTGNHDTIRVAVEACSETSQTSKVKFFCENSEQMEIFNYFRKKIYLMFGKVQKTALTNAEEILLKFFKSHH